MLVDIPNVRLTTLRSGHNAIDLHPRIMEQARDYLYQERVGHRLRRGGEAIAARVRGYQDHYTPAAEETPEGLRLTCSCGRSRLCAHAVALLLAFKREAEAFLPADRIAVEPSPVEWWPWMTGAAFPWDHVPERPTALMMPRTQDARWETAIPWREPSPARAHRAMLEQLGLVHPTWWGYPPFAEAFRAALADPALIHLARLHLRAWIDLLFRAPEIDLRPLWHVAAGLPLVAEWSHIRRLVWLAAARSRDETVGLRIARLLDLAEIAAESPTAEEEVAHMRGALAWADPTGLDYALYLDRQGRRAEAIEWLERRLPAEKAARAPYRALLVAWTDGPERIAHQVADLIEAPDPDKRRRLLEELDADGRARLARALPDLMEDGE